MTIPQLFNPGWTAAATPEVVLRAIAARQHSIAHVQDREAGAGEEQDA